MNIAMWSGPRNLSTAMMYAFAARADCAVIDEPFYAAYLRVSGAAHPMRDAVLAACSATPDRIGARCAAPDPGGRPLFYQKHMVHHMLPGFDRSWFGAVRHAFLIRHPARVIASYHARHEHPGADELGFRQQAELFDAVAQVQGSAPPVIDSADVRRAPGPALQALCAALGIAYDPAMLHWPAGGNPADGVWAAHWYEAVHRSTGFAAAEGALPTVPDPLRPLLDAALPLYHRLSAHRLSPNGSRSAAGYAGKETRG